MFKLLKNYLLAKYLLKKIEFLFFISLCFFLLFFLINETIFTLLYFQYFQTNSLVLIKIIIFDLLGSIETLFSFCAMLAILVTTQQLSRTSELTAYFAQGISINFIFTCVLRFTAVLGIFSFFIVAWMRPIFFEQREKLIAQIVHQGKFKFAPEKLNSIGDYIFYFKKKKGNDFYHILIFKRTNPLKGQIISAKKGNIKSSIAESLFSFELQEGHITLLPSPKKNYQITKFAKLAYPIQIGNTVQLANIETRVIKKQQRYTQYTLPQMYQKIKELHKIDKAEQEYYFIRFIFLFTRSLHNAALPLVGLMLGFFYPRLRKKQIYLKFFTIYILYYTVVIQLEQATLNGLISVWWNFLLPALSAYLSYYCFKSKAY